MDIDFSVDNVQIEHIKKKIIYNMGLALCMSWG